ncbi:MAG TPA: aspartyl/asparaginyl beta-hydroxylase domain-containing protein [Rhizomicrobium sp.]
MQSGADQRLRGLIAAARQAARQGQTHESARLLGVADQEFPDHPLMLNEHASRLLAAGNVSAAVTLLEQASALQSRNTEIWFNLGGAYRQAGRLDDAIAALDRVLEIEPRTVVALLEKGSLQELRDEPRAAAMSYRAALQMMPPGSKPPPGLELLLRRAKEAVDANNRALEGYIEDGLRQMKARFPDVGFQRFDRCVDIMLQKRRIYRQQPSFLFFPELPAIEFYERELFPWLDTIEAAADDIRAELLNVLSDGTALEPYVRLPKGQEMELWRELNNSRRWSVYSFWNEGKVYPEHIARCPKTVKALKAGKRWDVPGNGPTALFSVLGPKTRIPPHTGPVNTRLVGHLPLIVPPGCGFRVGGQQTEWETGKAFIFDDSIDHEAWNDSDLPRAILIFDTWSPFLSEAERELTRMLTTYVGEYYGSRSNRSAA